MILPIQNEQIAIKIKHTTKEHTGNVPVDISTVAVADVDTDTATNNGLATRGSICAQTSKMGDKEKAELTAWTWRQLDISPT